MADFTLKAGDLEPAIGAQLLDANKLPIDLTGKTVAFRMRLKSGVAGVYKVSSSATITTAASGLVAYSWTGTDTDTAGLYVAEFIVTAAGRPMTVPNATYLTVQVLARL
jgi:hypothetical protein